MDGRGLLTGGEGHYNSVSGDLQLLLQLLLLLRWWWYSGSLLAPFALIAPCAPSLRSMDRPLLLEERQEHSALHAAANGLGP